MIAYGLKLWTSNIELFEAAARFVQEGQIDFIELYHNAEQPIAYQKFNVLKPAKVIAIHHPHSHGFHELFFVNDEQRAIWKRTQELADFFYVSRIVLHPSRSHTIQRLTNMLHELNDSRIFIENMAGRDINGEKMQCGQTINDLNQIQTYADICFDFEKAVKAAREEGIEYKEFIQRAITELEPTYFHISGGDSQNPVDEHLNVWEGSIDMAWIKKELEGIAHSQDIYLVFEIPKVNGLENDIKNMDFFKNL